MSANCNLIYIASYNPRTHYLTASKSAGFLVNVYTQRYDTRCYFNVRSKADTSQLNLPHGTNN